MCWIDDLDWPDIDSREFESAIQFRDALIGHFGHEIWHRLLAEFSNHWDAPPQGEYFLNSTSELESPWFHGETLFQELNGDSKFTKHRQIPPKLTEPEFVGPVMQLIGDLRPIDQDQWTDYYRQSEWNSRIVEAAILMAQKIRLSPPFQLSSVRPFIESAIHWVRNLVLDRTYFGWLNGERVFLRELSNHYSIFTVRRATVDEDTRQHVDIVIEVAENIAVGIQVKPFYWSGTINSETFQESHGGRILIGRYKIKRGEGVVHAPTRFYPDLNEEIFRVLQTVPDDDLNQILETFGQDITTNRDLGIARIFVDLPQQNKQRLLEVANGLELSVSASRTINQIIRLIVDEYESQV